MPDTATPSPESTSPPVAAKRPRAKAAPTGRPVHQVLERLFELHPKLFGARFLPLKLGAFQDLMARHPGEFAKDELKAALGFHARSTRYLEAVASGEKRHDLDGNPVDAVAPEHVHHAIMEVFKRRQSRSKQDLRPWLKDRLIAVIDASGLSRDDYLERVHAQDELSVAALDEAFAEIAGRAARREALRRAFEASGKSVEEFADMYGMELAAVREALAA